MRITSFIRGIFTKLENQKKLYLVIFITEHINLVFSLSWIILLSTKQDSGFGNICGANNERSFNVHKNALTSYLEELKQILTALQSIITV